MKKILPVVVIATIAGWWFLMRSPEQKTPDSSSTTQGSSTSQNSAAQKTEPINLGGFEQRSPAGSSSAFDNQVPARDDSEEGDQVRPAADVYASADEAFAAVMKGSKDFDDSILEQFTEPSPDCSWCPQFYTSVREIVTNPGTSQDQKSYFAEVLAISGRVENIQTLVDSIKNARSSSDADVYAEALELSLGNNEVTQFLGDQLSTTNDTLRESAVAAITNQGSLEAVEILSKHVQERGDPDAYYSIGIGPGELIPNEDALPKVQELVQKRDQYSPGWAKSMVNAGLPGLTMLFDQLDTSNNIESDRALVKDIIEHVNYEDGLTALLDRVESQNKNPVALDLAQKIRQEFSEQEGAGDGVVEP